MKYFAKYLPVEGEIKEGDTYRVKGTDKVLIANKYFKEIDQSLLEKVKLFLCSRDITFPCDIYCFGEKVWRKNCQSTSCPDCVKVIGEISPEATWVKDGDEYLFGKVDKNGYICPYNQEDEKYIKFWTERGFRNLPNI